MGKQNYIKYFLTMLVGLLGTWACQDAQQGESPQQEGTSIPEVGDSPQVRIQALGPLIEKNPKDYSLYLDRSELYYEIDSLDQAIRDADKALDLYPQGPNLHFWRGFLATRSGDTALARTSFIEALNQGSQNAEAYYQLGQLEFFQGNEARALMNYQQAAQMDERAPIYVFAQAYLEEQRENYSEATRLYVEALERDSLFPKALTQLHDLYLNVYRNEIEALKYNDRLLRHQVGHPLGRFNRGNYHIREARRAMNREDTLSFQQSLNEAVTDFTIAINRDPQFARAYYARGLAYFLGQQRMDLALEDLSQSIGLDSTMAPAYFLLGSIYEYNGDLKTALSYFQQASRFKPESKDFQRAVQEVKARLR